MRATGRGALGGEGYPVNEVRVVDSVTVTTSRTGNVETRETAFEVMYWPVDTEPDRPLAHRPVSKSFASTIERDGYLGKFILPQLSLEPVSGVEFRRPGALEDLVGEELIAVWFVADYVQLQFQPTGVTPVPAHRGPLTCEVPPTFRLGEEHYADRMVALIRTVVVEADEYLDVGLYLRFEGGAELLIPLDGVGGYEVATFNTRAGLHVWTPRS